jgi:hypothetical protein
MASVGIDIGCESPSFCSAPARGLPSRIRYKRSFVILHEAWIDDSGTAGNGVYALCGYVLPAEEWKAFTDNWDTVLCEPPAIDFLKMKHAAKGFTKIKGNKVRWKTHDRDLKLRKLVSVLRGYDVLALESCLTHAEYARCIKGRLPQEYDNPYFFCFYDLIIGALQYQRRRHKDWEVHFVFDEQGKLGNNTKLWYGKLKSLFSKSLQSMMGPPPDFRNDEKFNPLQAADALAWTTRRVIENETKPKPYPIPLDIMEGFYNVPALHWRWDAKRLSDFVLDGADILGDLDNMKRKLKLVEGHENLDYRSRSLFTK